MDDYQNSVMIALLPTTTKWAKQPMPHLTLVYVGEIPDLKPTLHNDLLKTTYMLAMVYSPMTLDVVDVDVFGENDKKVDVLKIDLTDELQQLQHAVEHWSVSKFPFNPHVTVGPEGSISGTTPTMLTFDRIVVSWGENNTSYKLNKVF